MTTTRLVFLFWMLLLPWNAPAKILIDINQVSSDSFPIAVVPPFRDLGAEDPERRNEEFARTVRDDLEMMGIFRKIDPKAFLESPTKKAFTPAEIDWGSWALLDALALVKGWYRVEGRKLTIEAHLFDVLAKSELLAKRYEGSVEQATAMGHKFANEVVAALTGEPGVFETRIAFICEPVLHRGPCDRCKPGKPCEPHRHKELCLMDFDGGNVRQLTHYFSDVLSPVWSADGKSIFFTSYAGTKNFQLYRYNLENSSISKVSSLPGMTIGLSLDPVEPLLATSLTKDGNSEVYFLTLSGGIQKRITTNTDIDVSASFSPDGKQLVFVSDRDGGSQIFKMDRDGRNPARLSFKGNRNESPAWSPRGDKIVFAGLDTDRYYDLFSMNIDGSGMTRLTYDSGDNQEPKWAPGGALIGFSSNRTGTYQIWSMRPDGSKPMQLTRDPWNHSMPAWGPRPK